MRFCRPEFMKAIVEKAQQNNILVIFDEVAVGFGRTGSLFACEKIGCQPDLICLSKGLTAGYMPMSVTVATDDIYEAFKGDDFNCAFLHGHSFTANPLACAIALESLNIFESENTMKEIRRIESSHKKFLEKISSHSMVCKPRLMGSVVAFDLLYPSSCEVWSQNCDTSLSSRIKHTIRELWSGFNTTPQNIIGIGEGGYKSTLSEKMRDYFLKNNLNIRPLGPTIYLMPPYCISNDQLEYAYAKIIEGLDILVDSHQ